MNVMNVGLLAHILRFGAEAAPTPVRNEGRPGALVLDRPSK